MATKTKNEVVAFNAGELGAEALARTDLQNYPRGAETMENILPLVQGGMTKMPGTIYVAACPGEAELRPFIFSESVKFALEFSDSMLRIVSGGGSAPSGGTGEISIDPYFIWQGVGIITP